MVCCTFFCCINQRYGFVNADTPLLGVSSPPGTGNNIDDGHVVGPFGHSELVGELSVIATSILLMVLVSQVAATQLGLSAVVPFVGILLCLGNVILSTSRSAMLLFLAALVVSGLASLSRLVRAFNAPNRLVLLVVACLVFIALAGPVVGIGVLEDKFNVFLAGDVTMHGVLTGSSINRGYSTEQGVNRILSDSWIIGAGLGTKQNNLAIWTGNPMATTENVDDRFGGYFHSLYLSMPMLYGWVGSAAFMALIVMTLYGWSWALLGSGARPPTFPRPASAWPWHGSASSSTSLRSTSSATPPTT